MAVITKDNPRWASHWYGADGRPCHNMPRKSGDGERATTIRDAKSLGLFPSVTNILGIFAKPGLDNWKLEQVALASMRLSRTEGESDEYLCKRIIEDAFQQVEDAANLGSRIHDALDKYFEGEPIAEEIYPYVKPFIEWKQEHQLRFDEREIVVVNHEHGFAGRADIFFSWQAKSGKRGIGILDIKSRKTKPGEAVRAYDEHVFQLAAYAATHYGEALLPQVLAANAVISTTEVGRMEIIKHDPQRLAGAFRAFCSACDVWRFVKGYDPRQRKEASA